MNSIVLSSISRGIDFINDNQLPDGGFYSLSSTDQARFANHLQYKTTFFPSLILISLASIHSNEASRIKDKIASFLRTQASQNWSFNYWDRTSVEYIQQAYPDDLDDTFCALSALYLYDKSLFSGSMLAQVVQLLFFTEVEEGGPYNTWILKQGKKGVWHDVDLVVNANVGYFLSLHNVELPQLVGLIEDAIRKSTFSSKYYHYSYTFFYAISRWYKGKYTTKLLNLLVESLNQKDDWLNPLIVSMVLTTLLRLGYNQRKLYPFAEYLLRTQSRNGSWQAHAFYMDPVRNDNIYYAGSSALTTAFCIEALQLFNEKLEQKNNIIISDFSVDRIKNKVLLTTHTVRDKELRENINLVVGSFFSRNTGREIVKLPFIINSALALNIENSFLDNLSVLNTMGWIAYTIYDDFLDEEGKAWQLPVAHFCFRQLMKLVQLLLPYNSEFQIEAEAILEKIDAANVWEIAHCRPKIMKQILVIDTLPDYGDYTILANRSLGHTIPVIAIAYSLGMRRRSEELQSLRSFFKHYLIARQLNDDAHDWEKDLKKGHINAVCSKVLTLWQKKESRDELSLTEDLPQLRFLIWEEVIDEVTQAIRKHVEFARRAIDSDFIKNKDLLEELLQPLEKSAEDAATEKAKVQDFIESI